MMKTSRIILALTILSFIGTLFVYSSLPENIPIHWGINGEPDNYAGKSFALLAAALPFALYILMKVVPKIDPKRESYEKHKKSYNITRIAVIIILIGAHWVSLLIALGHNINISLAVKFAVGVLFIIIGNYMTQIRHNYFFGIRSPWTLASEKVWKKTHRVGGFGFMINGILFLIITPLRGYFIIIPLIYALLFVVGIYVYSYFLYKKENNI